MAMIIIRTPSRARTAAHARRTMPLVKKLFSLCPTASVAQWHSADPAPSCLAAADRGGHPHFCPARDRHPGVHGRHPTAGRLEVNWRVPEVPTGAGGGVRRTGAGGTRSCEAVEPAGGEGLRLRPISPCLRATGSLSVPRPCSGVPCPRRRLQWVSWGKCSFPGGRGARRALEGGCLGEGIGNLRKSPLKLCWLPFNCVPVSPLCRNTHAHGSHYNPIMQQPALLASHVTLPAAQPVNVGVAHVMRQPPAAAAASARKSKQHQSAPR